MTMKGNKHVVSITLSIQAFVRLCELAEGSSRSAVVEGWLLEHDLLDDEPDALVMACGRNQIVGRVRRRLKR